MHVRQLLAVLALHPSRFAPVNGYEYTTCAVCASTPVLTPWLCARQTPSDSQISIRPLLCCAGVFNANKVMDCGEALMRAMDKHWRVPIRTWNKVAVDVPHQRDTINCGVASAYHLAFLYRQASSKRLLSITGMLPGLCVCVSLCMSSLHNHIFVSSSVAQRQRRSSWAISTPRQRRSRRCAPWGHLRMPGHSRNTAAPLPGPLPGRR